MLVLMLFVFGTSTAQSIRLSETFFNTTSNDSTDADTRFADVKLSPEKDLGNFDYDASITRYVDCSKQVLIKTVCTVKTNPHGFQEI